MQTFKLAVKDFKVIMFNTFKKLDFFLKKHANTEMNHVFESIHFKFFCQFENRNEMYTFFEKIIYYKSRVQIVFYLLKILNL